MASVQEVLTPTSNNTPAVANITVYRYVNEVAEDGWVLTLEGASRMPLCKYTKVKLLGTKNGRTSFKVVDGEKAGRTASMTVENAKQYLGAIAPKDGLVEVVIAYGKYEEGWVSKARRDERLDQQWATLSIGGLRANVTMNTNWGTAEQYFPLPPGEYRILVPDVPHRGDMTTFYRESEPSLKHDQVWFPIDFGDRSRYVHVGNVSDGCVTVTDLSKWVDLHEILISHRSADKKYVGKLIVKGKPERAK